MVINLNCGKVKFISYTGKYPNLCTGTLTLDIDGERAVFGIDEEYPIFWEPGGGDGSSMGEWLIDITELPEKYRKYALEIDEVFNDNVDDGCCGGCL